MNFGGFVSLSTIDWRGRAVCTLFFRGCPIHCSYCQNESILTGRDCRDIDEIKTMIKASSQIISGVIFSGGEPTRQKDALIELAKYSKELQLDVGIQTNGFYPETLSVLIEQNLVDKVALDFKTRWEGYSGENYERNVKKTFKICKTAYAKNFLKEFEVVMTVFYENAQYIDKISRYIEKIPLVLQQGEHKIGKIKGAPPNMTEGEYRVKKLELQKGHPPLTLEEIKQIADKLGRKVRIRTREVGEILYHNGEVI